MKKTIIILLGLLFLAPEVSFSSEAYEALLRSATLLKENKQAQARNNYSEAISGIESCIKRLDCTCMKNKINVARQNTISQEDLAQVKTLGADLEVCKHLSLADKLLKKKAFNKAKKELAIANNLQTENALLKIKYLKLNKALAIEDTVATHRAGPCKIKEINDDENTYTSVIWDGKCVNGKAQGFGKAKRNKQSSSYFYEGYMNKGLAYGIGKNWDKKGELSYSGYYQNGFWHGPGISEYDDGKRLASYRKKGLPAGQMILAVQEAGRWYYGEFYCYYKSGECSGFGKASVDNKYLFERYVPDGKKHPQEVIQKYKNILANTDNVATIKQAEEDAVNAFWNKRELFKLSIIDNNFLNSAGKANEKNVEDVDVDVFFANISTKTIQSELTLKMSVRDNSPISIKHGSYKIDVTLRLYLKYKTSTILGTRDLNMYKHTAKVTFYLNKNNNWTNSQKTSLGNIDLGSSGRSAFLKIADVQLQMMEMDYTIH